jgi:hypothetical protein
LGHGYPELTAFGASTIQNFTAELRLLEIYVGGGGPPPPPVGSPPFSSPPRIFGRISKEPSSKIYSDSSIGSEFR